MLVRILLVLATSVPLHGAMPFHVDQPFIQDSSEQIPLAPEIKDARLLKVRMDRNGRILVLSDKGLLQVHAGTLRPDRQYRPLADMHIKDVEIQQGQFVYLTDTYLLSNASAGKLLTRASGERLPGDPNVMKPRASDPDRWPCADVRCTRSIGDVVWFGTSRGAFSLHPNDRIDYYASRRWLLDDAVVDIWPGPDGSVLVSHKRGLNIIHFQEVTLVTTPATSWFFAEGATGAFFDTYLLLANPAIGSHCRRRLPAGARRARTAPRRSRSPDGTSCRPEPADDLGRAGGRRASQHAGRRPMASDDADRRRADDVVAGPDGRDLAREPQPRRVDDERPAVGRCRHAGRRRRRRLGHLPPGRDHRAVHGPSSASLSPARRHHGDSRQECSRSIARRSGCGTSSRRSSAGDAPPCRVAAARITLSPTVPLVPDATRRGEGDVSGDFAAGGACSQPAA